MANERVALRHVDPPGSGIQLESPTLAGGLFTTKPLGKPQQVDS